MITPLSNYFWLLFLYYAFWSCLPPCWPVHKYHTMCSNVLWHTTHFQAPLFSHLPVPVSSHLLCLYTGWLPHSFFHMPLSAISSPPVKSAFLFILLPFSSLQHSIICSLCLFGFPQHACSSSPSATGFLDSHWHLAVVPFLTFLPARLHWMTGALVEVLLWLLAQAFSQGAPLACLSSPSVPGPWPPTPTPLASATKLLSVHRPHVSGLKALFKTQVLPRRHCSRNREGNHEREGVDYSAAWKGTEEDWTRKSDGNKA